MRRFLMLALLLLHGAAWAAEPPARVIVIGTYHFSNPGQDKANVDAVDVTVPQRQAELQAVTDALATFQPTFVGVEWPADAAREQYARHLAGTLPPSSNEVVQLGFRLAKQVGLTQVHGLDVPGDFPFEPLSAWAQANGKAGDLDALMAQAQGITARITALQATHSIGGVLREMNTARATEEAASFYAEFLRYGSGDQQPGVELNAAWAKRNYAICARLLQALKPGDRAVVFYGQGHVPQLAACLRSAPGVELVEAGAFLPAS
ncbi:MULTISPECIES: DUF5694 domain-containing protein [unclassified Pseudoxanthomonas]|uniref:DUF5694 domain-containing protein n=1 Tax=unclassified Pseudoxanthomonas TaxID=2645906 RepID=UPI0008E26388|nr:MULTISPECIES: DUF5694 domain-containing protein [unclassified Pseudoxanthomonas]SFV26228.1 hypothetical protein SAMN05428990_0202 [Pseudoxanthomonas sp. YR558]